MIEILSKYILYFEECVGDASTWDAGWGTCDTYDASDNSGNHKYCEEDIVDGQYASQVCQECGACIDLGTFNSTFH